MSLRPLVFYFARRVALRSPRGFTLTEVAVVLGIAGIIVGAVWGIAASVSESNKVKTAVQDVGLILSGYRGLYTRSITAADVAAGSDVTCSGYANGFFPTSLSLPLPALGCVSGTWQTYPTTPWANGAVTPAADGSDNGFFIVTLVANQGIQIGIGGLPRDACIRIASQIPSTSDVIAATINGTTYSNNTTLSPVPPALPFPITPEEAAGNCLASPVWDANMVSVLYQVP